MGKVKLKTANDNDVHSLSSTCSVCGAEFTQIQECLKHELIQHTLKKNNNRLNPVQKRLNATYKTLNADEKLLERSQLKERLKKCKNGHELPTIFEMFCMKADNFSFVFTRIQTCLEKELSSVGVVRVCPFGSIANGLALRDCDIDIFLDVSDIQISPKYKKNVHKGNDFKQRSLLNRFNKVLHTSPHFISVYAIRGARVPIIKCTHKDTGFNIDINISCPSSQKNSQFIYKLTKSDNRVHELMLFLKLWAKNNRIIGRDNMTSYCFINMVIFFLQQPWKLDSQENSCITCCILKPIKELQKDCGSQMVHGVNYAYNLQHTENKLYIPSSVTTWDLIKAFFNFYKDFNFEDLIISTYYGKSIEKTNLIPDMCGEYYRQLRTLEQFLQPEKVYGLQIDRCMCIQDLFCLNQNIAKNIQPNAKQYIVLCLQNAYNVCENPNQITLGELYEELLFVTIKTTNQSELNKKSNSKVMMNLKTIKLTPMDTSEVRDNECKLVYKRIPCKTELNKITDHYLDVPNKEALLRCWCKNYVKVIQTIITQLYLMDMQIETLSQQKQQKLDSDVEHKELNQSWQISCTIDLWTNRCFQKNTSMSYLSYQMGQTERLHNLRRQDPKFSVSFNAILKLYSLPNYMGMALELHLADGKTVASLNKKSPLRKFFNILKNTIESCNLKDAFNINATKLNNAIETIKPHLDAMTTT